MLLLADEFFLVAHDDFSGRRRLAPHTMALGLSGAILGELVLFGRITIQSEKIHLVDPRPPRDGLAHTVLDQLANESEVYEVREWLQYLATTIYDDVGMRLVRNGNARRTKARRLLHTELVYQPVDVNYSGTLLASLSTSLYARYSFTIPETALLGLLDATGLDRLLLRDGGAEARKYLHQVIGLLPGPLRELIGHTEAAVADAVLHHKR